MRATAAVAVLLLAFMPALARAEVPTAGQAERQEVPDWLASARAQLPKLVVKRAGSMTGYGRAQFGPEWPDVDRNGCDTRNDVLKRDLVDITLRAGSNCVLAAHGPTNGAKGDRDAARWLPPNVAFHCRYVVRQISIKRKYRLWVTRSERRAMVRTLAAC